MTKTEINKICSKIDKKCCGKKMKRDDQYFNGEDTTSFICVTCGHFISIANGQLDEDDLENYK